MRKRLLATIAGILASSVLSISGKPYEKPFKETYFRKGFAVEGENFLYSYVKAYGSKNDDCTLRLEDKIQIEDRGCDEHIERIYYDHMKAVRIGDGKEPEKYLEKAFLIMGKYTKKIDFENAKKRWEARKPKTLAEELKSYLDFVEGKKLNPKFWMYGFNIASAYGLSTEGDYSISVFSHEIIGEKTCRLRPLTLPEAPGIDFVDYDCDNKLDVLRDSVDVKVYVVVSPEIKKSKVDTTFPPELKKEAEEFVIKYKKAIDLEMNFKKWEEFKKETLDKLKILDSYLK